MINSVISVCCLRDIQVWTAAAPYILKNIKAKNYYVIVPGSEVERFAEISPKPYVVLNEDEVFKGLNLQSLANFLPEAYRYRAGWYLQQLIKIAALDYLEAAHDDLMLIWDADTVPLKELNFYQEGRCIYFMGEENHPPYFISLKNLFDLEKLVNFSFIAQCFVVKKVWIKEFLDELEDRHATTWYKAILEKSDLSHPSGFSEYETIGNWLMARHKSEIAFSPAKWERFGSSRCGLKNIERFASANPNMAFISFESWDGYIGESSLVQMTTLGRNGRFGNQIFQYFFLKLVESRFGYEVRCPSWLGNQFFNLAPTKELISSAFPIDWQPVVQRNDTPDIDFQRVEFLMSHNNTNSLDVSGYFHYHTKALLPYKELFLSTFKIDETYLKKLNCRLAEITRKKIVAIHVRATDFITLEKEGDGTGFAMSPSFEEIHIQIKRLKEKFGDEIAIYLASDDLMYASSELSSLGIECFTCQDLFPNGSDEENLFVDFSLLSIADIVLISNSSFSFSAAMLNQKADLFFRPCINTKKFIPFDPWSDYVLHMKTKTLYV